MPIIRSTSGRSFSAAADQSILDAAIAAGVTLPYGCRTGRCGTCRCRVETGETRPLLAETGLDATARAEGWVLACVRTAIDDVTLDYDDLGDVVLPAPKTLPCRIAALDRMSDDVLRVRLRLPPSAAFAYLPGQYVEIIGFGGVRRSYSLAAAGPADAPLELHVGRVPGGVMSAYWFDRAKEGDLLRLHGPFGTFVLRDVAGADLVFLATGTGFAPVAALLQHIAVLAPERAPRSITLYRGARREDDLYGDVAASPLLRVVPVLSRAPASWTGRRGHVQDAVLADHPDLTRTVVYACGSPAMVRDAETALAAAGLPAGRFFSDAFVPSSTASEP
ncbi:MAG: 2Fe-2S iron-sulfur cluster binding domain-containing protein [Phyllobacteriaceae bacterium]|nr:2Fe-2S iron-sulfur cluster binding domain-containing protein [Phyllobacteriaceae bacterium]